MRKYLLVAYFLLFNVLKASPKDSTASIRQNVEIRNGKNSCWGVVIVLKKFTFNKTILANEITIIEFKHSSDLKDIMIWKVDKSRKKLSIKFKKGSGDFGTGNAVEVTIKASAFKESPTEPISLTIGTDIK